MSRLLRVAAFLATVFLAGCLLAPLLWLGVQAVAPVDPTGLVAILARQPFHRYVQRAVLGLAVAGLWPLARSLGVRRWDQLGWSPVPGALREWAAGWAWGTATLGLALAIEGGLGIRGWKPDLTIHAALVSAGLALLAALAVAPLEETVYRGVLCRGLQPSLGWPGAIGVSALVYAWVHFLGKPAGIPEVSWSSGFTALRGMLAGLVDGPSLVPGLPTLVIAGVLLGWMYQRTGRLYLPAGLHAGWIFWMKLRGGLTASAPGAGDAGARGAAGWTGLIMLGGAAVAMAWWVGRREGRPSVSAAPGFHPVGGGDGLRGRAE